MHLWTLRPTAAALQTARAGDAGLPFPGELHDSLPMFSPGQSTDCPFPSKSEGSACAASKQIFPQGSKAHTFRAAGPASPLYLIDLPPLC